MSDQLEIGTLAFLSETHRVQSRDYFADSYQYCVSKYLHY